MEPQFVFFKKLVKHAAKILIPLALAAGILWWMYRDFEWTDFQQALSDDVDWTWMWISFPFGISAQVFRALRWRLVLAPMGEHPRRCVTSASIFISYASSLVVPRVGEVLRCAILRRYEGVSFTRSVGSVVTERVIDMAMIMALSLVTVACQIPVFLRFCRQTGLSVHTLLGQFTATGYAVTMLCGVAVVLTGIVLWSRFRKALHTQRLFHDLRDGLLSVTRVDRPWLFMAWSVGIWASYFLHFYLTFFCFGFTSHLGIDVALVAFVVGCFAVIVPTPNGAGPWHFAVKTVLVLYGVGATQAAMYALAVHTVQTLLVAVLGMYAVGVLAAIKSQRNNITNPINQITMSNQTIHDLNPQEIWKNFYLLTQVPRPSGHLEKVQKFLLDWAAERGIEAFKDGAENIVMRKPATPGMEGHKTAVLQAHMDMVPQKTDDSTHNFETDPIETWIDGEWIKAKGTTLGSDDGMGVAAIMAVMESKDLVHGPLEALITADEETCMYGVNHLAADTLKGDILLNIDNETMGEFVIGSAGGVNITASIQYKESAPEEGDQAYLVTIKDLKGGHSGLEINQGRANANKLMARLVRQAIIDDDARLASWKGGNMRNAIPRTAQVVLTIPKENGEDLRELAAYCLETFTQEYRGVEEGITLTVEPTRMPEGLVPEEIQDNIVDALMACHDGVLRNIPSIPSVVETSSNLGIVEIGTGRTEVLILARSSSESMMEYLMEMQSSCFNMAGMKVDYSGQYGAWQPNFDSPITAKMVEVYRNLFNEEAVVQVCHAGLECSIIGGVYPKMDLVSFGPTLRSPHTPGERCHIPSVEKFWTFLKALLAAI